MPIPTVNPELDKSIRDWSVTKARIAEADALLKELKESASGAEQEIIKTMETLGETVRRVDAVTVKVSSRKEGGRASYKEGFEFLLSKVNDQLKQMADDFIESTKGDTWVRRFLVKESLSEGIMARIWMAIKELVASFAAQLRSVQGDVAALESMVTVTKESRRVALASALIESAVR
jgi:hypothetical protein